jgi:hypothetical protein
MSKPKKSSVDRRGFLKGAAQLADIHAFLATIPPPAKDIPLLGEH